MWASVTALQTEQAHFSTHLISVTTLTFAQMLAALTIGYNESAFFATVIFTEGKHSSSFLWYAETSPTVST